MSSQHVLVPTRYVDLVLVALGFKCFHSQESKSTKKISKHNQQQQEEAKTRKQHKNETKES